MEAVFALSVLALLLFLYLLPMFIASRRKHPNILAISLINIFLGWTTIAWFAVLIWAIVTPVTIVINQGHADDH